MTCTNRAPAGQVNRADTAELAPLRVVVRAETVGKVCGLRAVSGRAKGAKRSAKS